MRTVQTFLTGRGTGLAALLTGLLLVGQVHGDPRRDTLMVGNAEGGTVSFLDGHSFENLGSVNVVPDLDWRLFLSLFRPVRAICREVVQTQKGEKYVDDLRLLPDGRTLIVSRGTLGDVIAFDLREKKILWREDVGGCLADHIDLSPDGTTVAVSDILFGRVLLLDTETGDRVGKYPAGTFPHGNHYSADGNRIYTGSIGNPLLPYEQNELKGDRLITVADANTTEVLRTYEFDYGVRPFVLTPDETVAYIQLSFQRGFVEFDMGSGEILRDLDLPASESGEGTDPNDYPMDSAHHGLAMSGDSSYLCNAGTIDDYVAIVGRANFDVRRIPVGDIPYWSSTSHDGKHCLVSNSGDDNVSVINYRDATEIDRVPVGDFPQRIRRGQALPAVIDGLDPADG